MISNIPFEKKRTDGARYRKNKTWRPRLEKRIPFNHEKGQNRDDRMPSLDSTDVLLTPRAKEISKDSWCENKNTVVRNFTKSTKDPDRKIRQDYLHTKNSSAGIHRKVRKKRCLCEASKMLAMEHITSGPAATKHAPRHAFALRFEPEARVQIHQRPKIKNHTQI
jgi:hypothetical protein